MYMGRVEISCCPDYSPFLGLPSTQKVAPVKGCKIGIENGHPFGHPLCGPELGCLLEVVLRKTSWQGIGDPNHIPHHARTSQRVPTMVAEKQCHSTAVLFVLYFSYQGLSFTHSSFIPCSMIRDNSTRSLVLSMFRVESVILPAAHSCPIIRSQVISASDASA